MRKTSTHFPHMVRIIKAVWGAATLGLLLGGCGAGADVTIAAPDVKVDTTNPIVTQLVAALPQNAQANTFAVNWSVVPDPARPGEAIPHSLIYDRKAKTLAYYRDMPRCDLYSGVTDDRLKKVADKGNSLPTLTQLGCTMKIQDPQKAN